MVTYSPDSQNPVWSPGDYPGAEAPDNSVVLRSRTDGSPVQYNSKYWVAYDDTENGIWLFSATDLLDPTTYTDEGEFISTNGITSTDFLDMSGIDDTTPFWLFTADKTNVDVHKTADMSSFSTTASIASGNLESPEDFSLQQRSNGEWYAVYERDGDNDGVAVVAASCPNTSPDSGWVNEGNFLPDGAADGVAFVANPTLLRNDRFSNGTIFECIYEVLSGSPGSPTEPFYPAGAWVTEAGFLDKSRVKLRGQLYSPPVDWEDENARPNGFVYDGTQNVVFYTGDSATVKELGILTGEPLPSVAELSVAVNSEGAKAITDTGSGVGAMTDTFPSSGLSTVSSTVEMFDAQEAFSSTSNGTSISSWAGESGVATVDGGSATLQTGVINTYRALYFDGGSTSVGFTTTQFTQAQPYCAISVVNADFAAGEGANHGVTDNESGTASQMYWSAGVSPEAWAAFAGGSVISGGDDQQAAMVLTAIFDGASSSVRVNGTEVGSGDAGANGLSNGLTIGAGRGGGANFLGHIGFVEIHNASAPSNGLSTREQEVADAWGITL